MAEGLLHHVNVTVVGESVGIDLARSGLCLVILAIIAHSEIRVVGVVGFTHGLVGLVVVESLGHGTALAASARSSAVKSLLDRKRCQLALLHAICTFESTDGGEGPVGAALALIGNSRNKAVLSPVDRGGDVSVIGHPGDVLGLLLEGLSIA